MGSTLPFPGIRSRVFRLPVWDGPKNNLKVESWHLSANNIGLARFLEGVVVLTLKADASRINSETRGCLV